MMRVQVELWMWFGKELGCDFQSPSEMCSLMEMKVEEGMTLKKLFDHLAGRYPPIGKKIFNRETQNFYPNLTVMITFKGRVISFPSVDDTVLTNGYKIMVLPLYAGG
jgi:molybdopterin converting factor small subunit